MASTRIAKQKGMAVCSATVRNAMARLEKEGLLYSPHTSAGRVPTEASGGIDLDTIHAKAATGVDYVSVGRLTQSAPAADIGLDFTPL